MDPNSINQHPNALDFIPNDSLETESLCFETAPLYQKITDSTGHTPTSQSWNFEGNYTTIPSRPKLPLPADENLTSSDLLSEKGLPKGHVDPLSLTPTEIKTILGQAVSQGKEVINTAKEMATQAQNLINQTPSSPDKLQMAGFLQKIIGALNQLQELFYQMEIADTQVSQNISAAQQEENLAKLKEASDAQEKIKQQKAEQERKQKEGEGLKTFLNVLSWIGRAITIAVAVVVLGPLVPAGPVIAAGVIAAVVTDAVGSVTGHNYIGETLKSIQPSWLSLTVSAAVCIVSLPADVFNGFQVLSDSGLIAGICEACGVDPAKASIIQMAIVTTLAIISIIATLKVNNIAKVVNSVDDISKAATGAEKAARSAGTFAADAAAASAAAQGTSGAAAAAANAQKAASAAQDAANFAAEARRAADLLKATQKGGKLTEEGTELSLRAMKNAENAVASARQAEALATGKTFADLSAEAAKKGETAISLGAKGGRFNQFLAKNGIQGDKIDDILNQLDRFGRDIQTKHFTFKRQMQIKGAVEGITNIGQGAVSIIQASLQDNLVNIKKIEGEYESFRVMLEQLLKILENFIKGMLEAANSHVDDAKSVGKISTNIIQSQSALVTNLFRL